MMNNIYIVFNEEFRPVYIGQTVREVSEREEEHRKANKTEFDKWLKEHPNAQFYTFLEGIETKFQMNFYEKALIALFQTKKKGLNTLVGNKSTSDKIPERLKSYAFPERVYEPIAEALHKLGFPDEVDEFYIAQVLDEVGFNEPIWCFDKDYRLQPSLSSF